jgi:hypothetical protein
MGRLFGDTLREPLACMSEFRWKIDAEPASVARRDAAQKGHPTCPPSTAAGAKADERIED